MACTAGLFYAQYSAGAVEIRSVSFGIALVRRNVGVSLSLDALLLIFIFGAVSIGLATRRPLQEVLAAMAISSAGLLFIALPFSYLVRIELIERFGRELVLFTLVLIWAGDMLAYFVGRFLGRVPMAPVLSPKKTWEGAFANLVASLLVGFFFARWMGNDVLTMLVIAALANIAGQMGDLIESAYKRGAAVKDSGGLVPGHGGVFDRVDSLILAAPVVCALYGWLGH
jgi:phosphatidate cytidylyltransferase